MYKNYIPELPEKYNEINEKLGNKELLTQNETKKELYIELNKFLDSERLKLTKEYPIPGNKEENTFFGVPIEVVTISDFSKFDPFDSADFDKNEIEAIKVGHLYILETTHRKPGSSYFRNFTSSEIKNLLLSNNLEIDPCLIKYGYDHDYYGCLPIAPFTIGESIDGETFICDWG